jgi:hypothetical protein
LEDLKGYALNAKQGIEFAENHQERLTRYQFYVSRLATMLGRLPDMDEALGPLADLKREIDLLIHHHKSDLLRPVAASRTTPTFADQTFRMVSVLAYRLHRQVGYDEKQARTQVARLIQARGYRSSRGEFGAAELKNWIAKVENGDYPQAKGTVGMMMSELPSIAKATTQADAGRLSKEMLARTALPPASKAQADKNRDLD